MNHYYWWQTVLDLGILEKAQCGVEEKRTLFPLVDQLLAFCERARMSGILALESVLATLTPPLLKTGLRLAVDGTDPDLIRRVMYYQSLCGGAKGVDLLRNLVIMEGVLAIQQGSNPRVLRDIVLSLFGDDVIAMAEKHFETDQECVRREKELVKYCDSIMARPAVEPHTLLEEPFAKMFPASVQAVLREVADDTLAVALGRAGGRTVATVLRYMSPRKAMDIIESMKLYENPPDTAVVRAQNEITAIIERLKKTGEVFMMPPNLP